MDVLIGWFINVLDPFAVPLFIVRLNNKLAGDDDGVGGGGDDDGVGGGGDDDGVGGGDDDDGGGVGEADGSGTKFA